MLHVSAVSVIIVNIAIYDMPRQEFSLCERVYIHNTYEKQKAVFWNMMQILSYANGSLLLVGSPLLDRSNGRGQTKKYSRRGSQRQ